MAGAAPDLIIPVRMDADKALTGLTKVGAAGAHAGDQVAAGAQNAQKGIQGMTVSSDKLGVSLVGLMKAQLSFQAMRETATAIGSAFNDTAKYVQQMAKEFQGLRKTMQEVATLKDVANENQFTLEEAKKAQAFHLTPQEYRDFQAQFTNYASAQIGTNEQGGVAEGAKLTEKQGTEYARRIAELMKASGINPQIGAELAGALLEQKKEPQDVEKLMGELSKTFTVLEKSRVPLSQALPQMTQIMGHGISAEEAAKIFSIVALASPGAEEMAVEAALRVIEETKAKGTGKEFGVKEGMTQYESVKAFAENIDKRKQDLIAGGKTEQEATDIVNKKLAEVGVAADVREHRGLIAGFGRQGVELGHFECYEKIARETPQDFEKARIQKYEELKQGRQDKVDVAEAVAKVEAAERNERLVMWRQIAEIELTKDGASGCDQPTAELASHLAGASDARTILVNQQATRRAQVMFSERKRISDTVTATNQGVTDQLLRELLKRLESIDEQAKKANAQRMGVVGPPAPPLVAPPAGGANKRGS